MIFQILFEEAPKGGIKGKIKNEGKEIERKLKTLSEMRILTGILFGKVVYGKLENV